MAKPISTDDVIESCYIRQDVSPTRPMPPLNFVSPATETTKKRPWSRSPYVSVKSQFKRTPSKQPNAKKMRKCLLNNTPSKLSKPIHDYESCSSKKRYCLSYGEDLGILWATILDKLKEKDLGGTMLEFFQMVKD